MTGQRNWARVRSRERIRRHGAESVHDDAAQFTSPQILASLREPRRISAKIRAPRRRPSKAEMRAETAALLEQYRGPIQKEPTRLQVTCPKCGQQGTVTTELRSGLRFRCTRCGHRDPIIAGCDQLRRWSTSRRR